MSKDDRQGDQRAEDSAHQLVVGGIVNHVKDTGLAGAGL